MSKTISNSKRYGLLINHDLCTGCHTCEMACKVEHNLTVDQWGIKILEDGPRQTLGETWEWTYVPLPTDLCDLCKDRVAAGNLPTCVKHCQAGVMEYGIVAELAEKMTANRKMVLFTMANGETDHALS